MFPEAVSVIIEDGDVQDLAEFREVVAAALLAEG